MLNNLEQSSFVDGLLALDLEGLCSLEEDLIEQCLEHYDKLDELRAAIDNHKLVANTEMMLVNNALQRDLTKLLTIRQRIVFANQITMIDGLNKIQQLLIH